jgi:outer membrane biosynthesis protein TonB
MKNIFAIVISTLALTAFAADAPGPKKPCKEGQTEADGCHVVKKAEKKPVEKKADTKPAEKKADTKPVEAKVAEKPAAKPADKPAEKK